MLLSTRGGKSGFFGQGVPVEWAEMLIAMCDMQRTHKLQIHFEASYV